MKINSTSINRTYQALAFAIAQIPLQGTSDALETLGDILFGELI